MPVSCKLIKGKYRIVEPSGKIAKGSKGNPSDGGGHSSKSACNRQARAINRSIHQIAIEPGVELGSEKQGFLSRIVGGTIKAYVDFQSRLDDVTKREGLAGNIYGDIYNRGALPGAYYDAAKTSKINRDWRPRLASADQAILGDLDSLIARSRSMLRNDGVSTSGRKAFIRHVVGSGITARSSARHPQTHQMLDSYNEILDRLWNNWANTPSLCDLEKTKLFVEKEALWVGEMFEAGGLFIVLGYVPNPENVGLTLQEIEYEQANTTIRSFEGKKVKSGVEVDEYGAPVAYHLFTKSHPSEDFKPKSTRIPAKNVIHIFRQERIKQTKGIPWLSAVMPSIRNLAIYEQSMLLKARTEAAYHGIVEQQASGGFGLPENVARQIGAVPPASEVASTDTTANSIEVNIQPGLFPVLNPGQVVRFPTPGTPNTMYEPFVSEQLKRIAAGVGLDIATVSRWYGDTNFSAQKQAKLDVYAETDPIQSILITKVLTRIRNTFIEFAIKEKRLKAVGYYETYTWRDAYRTTNWQGPARPSVEPLKDAKAAEALMDKGLLSPQQYFNERGMEMRDVYAELEEAKKLQKKHGLDFDPKPLPVARNGNPRDNGKPNDDGKGKKFSSRFADRIRI